MHTAKDFPNLRSLARAATYRPEYLKEPKTVKAVYLLLAHLCRQLDTDMDTAPDTEYMSFFEGLVSTLDVPTEIKNEDVLAVNIASGVGRAQLFKKKCMYPGTQKLVLGENRADVNYGGFRVE